MKVKFIHIVSIVALVATQSCLLPSNDYLFENMEQTIVIEGRITDCDTQQKIIVSKTVFGENSTDNQYINNAVVRIINEKNDNEELLEFIGNGQYVTENIIPQIGTDYRLEVEAEGGLYHATETFTNTPDISHVFSIYQNSLPYEAGEFLFFVFHKTLDSLAYYKVEVVINGEFQNSYYDLMVFDDRLFAENQLMMLPYALDVGDTASVSVYSLSENMYEYYLGLSKQTTNLYSNIQPPQVNPENNLSGGVLGYFQASSVYKMDTVIHDEVNQ